MLTKEETWEKLRTLDWASLPLVRENKIPKGQWNLAGMGQCGHSNGVDLKGTNLSGVYLGGADLSGAILSNADLSKAELIEAALNGANLSGANLSGAYLDKAHLSAANLSNANLSNAQLYLTNFSKADLSGANLRESDIDEANMNLVNLSGADITGSTFWGVSITGWKIEGIKAHYVYFCHADEVQKEKYKRNFQKGQFEALFRSLPTVELIFAEGLSLTSLFTLSMLIERIGSQNPNFGVKMAGVNKNEFETRVGVKLNKDEYLGEVGRLIHDAMDQVAGGISFDTFVPYLKKMLPENFGEALESQQMQASSIVVNIIQPTLQLIKADGSTLTGTITQRGITQSPVELILKNYGLHRAEVDNLFYALRESFGENDASLRASLIEASDRMIEALSNSKGVSKVQNYWEEIKAGIQTGGAAATIASTIGRLLGFM